MFARLSKLLRGFLSLFVTDLETSNPQALLEGEVASLQDAVGSYNKALAKQAGMVERLRGQVLKERNTSVKLNAKVQALVQAGQMEDAGRWALEAKNQATFLLGLEEQLEQNDKQYRNLTHQRDVYVRDAHRRIQAIKQKLSQAEIAESQAKLAEIATATSFDLAGSGATLERLEEKLDERVAEAKGKARVASDQAATGGWTIKAEEEKALEDSALAEFINMMGIPKTTAAPPQAAPAPTFPRELGT